MNELRIITYDCFLEIKQQKIFYFYWVVTLIPILFFIFVPGSLKIDGNSISLDNPASAGMLLSVMAYAIDGFIGFMILLLVFGSAGLVPAYLGRGRAELILSRPLSRMRILISKFLAVYLIMISILTVSAGLLWLTLSLKTNLFGWNIVYGLIVTYIQFFVVYAIVFFFGAVSGSGVLAIIGYFVVRIGFDLFQFREIARQIFGDSFIVAVLDGIYHIGPKIAGISGNFVPLMEGQGLSDFYAIWSSFLFGLALIIISLVICNRKDY